MTLSLLSNQPGCCGDITSGAHITALGNASDRIEVARCHISATMGCMDVFVFFVFFGFHMSGWHLYNLDVEEKKKSLDSKSC